MVRDELYRVECWKEQVWESWCQILLDPLSPPWFCALISTASCCSCSLVCCVVMLLLPHYNTLSLSVCMQVSLTVRFYSITSFLQIVQPLFIINLLLYYTLAVLN
ncbi:hypothetical protein JHK82_028805 [Glycine max]|nr:hypothetical protein JHK82_028805 [Glycine max]KAG5152584.1 hypothetical protein JHK84_029056 [Glycine max]